MSIQVELLYGQPGDVIDILDNEDLTSRQLAAALINAMNRIAYLEKRVRNLYEHMANLPEGTR